MGPGMRSSKVSQYALAKTWLMGLERKAREALNEKPEKKVSHAKEV